MVDREFDFDENGLPKLVTAEEKRRREVQKGNALRVEESDEKRKRKVAEGSQAIKQSPKKGRSSKKQSGSVTVNDDLTGRTMLLYQEKLPNGGVITLQNPGEVSYFKEMKSRYAEEYPNLISKANDCNRLSQLLAFELTAYRYTQRMMGQVTSYADDGSVAGVEVVPVEEVAMISQNLPKIHQEIRSLEVSLKIDKKTREGSGEGDIRNYMETLRRAAIQYKVRISDRYSKFDEFIAETRWRMRVFRNADAEDRKYHGIETAEDILQYIEKELKEMEELDKEFAVNKQSLWLGRI